MILAITLSSIWNAHQNSILRMRGFNASVAILRICQLHVGDGDLSACYVGRSSRFVSHTSNLLGAARVCICFNVTVMCWEFTKCVSDVQSMLPKGQWLAILRGHRDTIQWNMYPQMVVKTLQVRTPYSNWFLTAKPAWTKIILMMLFPYCRTVYRTGYITRYRTVYSSQFACCPGYVQRGTQCQRKPAAIALLWQW